MDSSQMRQHFQNMLLDAVKGYFKSIGIKYAPKDKSVVTPLCDYFNVQMKQITIKPRQIVRSDKFKSLNLPESYLKALQFIERKIENGEDVNPHLSKKSIKVDSYDWLLNEWFIYHIHISNTKKSPGQKFYDTSKYLLFVFFSSEYAIFIDIREHNEPNVFAKLEYLEIMERNWPDLMKPYLMDWKDVSPELDDEGRDILRRKGYSIGAVKVNGKVYWNPGVAIATTGISINCVRLADKVYLHLLEIAESIEKEKEGIMAEIRQQTGHKLSKLNLKLVRIDLYPYFAFFETSIQKQLNFDSPA